MYVVVLRKITILVLVFVGGNRFSVPFQRNSNENQLINFNRLIFENEGFTFQIVTCCV